MGSEDKPDGCGANAPTRNDSESKSNLEEGCKKVPTKDRFSQRIYVAGFGSYEGDQRSEEPDNERLVGREEQRTRLLNLLLNTARRGAYLVTGHRGSGKTTFVNYCLAEYRFEVFYRYLKSTLGRAFLWDRLGLVLLVLLVYVLGILLHQVLAYLLNGSPDTVLTWVLIFFLTLVGCYPFVAAHKRLRLIWERLIEVSEIRLRKDALLRGREESGDPRGKKNSSKARGDGRGHTGRSSSALVVRVVAWLTKFVVGGKRPNVRPLVVLIFLSLPLWFLLPLSSPAEAMAELVFAAGWLFLFACLAHETFPRNPEIHIMVPVLLAGADLAWTNGPLRSSLAHDVASFWLSGVFACFVGLLLVAHHKHGAIQRWMLGSEKRQKIFFPSSFYALRPSSLRRFFQGRGSSKGADFRAKPLSFTTLIILWLAIVFSLALWVMLWIVRREDLLEDFLNGLLLWDLPGWLEWSVSLSMAFLALVLLPVLVDLILLCLPRHGQGNTPSFDRVDFARTAGAIASSARWHMTAGIVGLSIVLYFAYAQGQENTVAYAGAKAAVAVVVFFALHVLFRLVRYPLSKRGLVKEREPIPEQGESDFRINSRIRTRAFSDDEEQELLQAGIGGQHAQPMLLLFVKALILIQIGLQLTYPTWAFIHQELNEVTESFEAKARVDAPLADKAGAGMIDLFSKIYAANDAENQGDSGEASGETGGAEQEAGESELAMVAKWLLSLMILTGGIVFLEYEWIVRGGQHVRPDKTMRHRGDPNRMAAGGDDEVGREMSRTYQRRLLKQTIFYQVYQSWLPILTVPVNLGFDTLDHRRVVEAMLIGLRDNYKKLFLQWTSPVRLVLRGGGILLIAWATTGLGEIWFGLESDELASLRSGNFCEDDGPVDRRYYYYFSYFGIDVEALGGRESRESMPGGMRLACLGGETVARTVQWEFIGPHEEESTEIADHYKKSIDGYENSILSLFFPEIERTGFIAFRVYHAILFLALFVGSSWYLKRNPFLPYLKILDEIELLLSQVSSRQREESRYHPAILPRLVGVLTGEDKVKHWEAEPFDPRTIEISFLRILRDIQDPMVYFPYLATHRVNLPTPEIVFKFDELDKLGIGVLPQHDTAGPEVGETEEFNIERQRTRSLHNLFADLKNLVSSGSARFIFIGGRNLHDEWLADQTARRPLLTNIFDAEIYLPSLLIEDQVSDGSAQDLSRGIEIFIEAQYQHALARNHRALLHRYRPWLTPWLEHPEAPVFVQSPFKYMAEEDQQSSEAEAGLPSFELRMLPLWWLEPAEEDRAAKLEKAREEWRASDVTWRRAHIKDFMEFLAYRSRGNVKRLKATLERFIEPSLKVLGQDFLVDSQHVLVFRDIDRFRIQLIAEVYRRILTAFDPRIRFQDDKLVVGLLYIADFLLKFHRRAFAWNSLQKVDELVHIHRAPDLPAAIADLLHAWQQKYLHHIRNGMYDYRFNSGFAMELRYLSRRSDEELAALNFTLDESQALKAIYRSRFSTLKDSSANEFVAVLGELHEFDGEHEVARYYYNRALSYLDENFHGQVARKKRDEPAVYSVLSLSGKGFEVARRRIAWGVARLRLQMQIGMSYELSNDLEQAQASYRNARTFATALVLALLNATREHGEEVALPAAPDYGYPDFMSTLKHLNLLFQPALAEAWVSEKHPGGVDTSTRLIERSLWELRWRLPMVREEYDPKNRLRFFRDWTPDHNALHLNFALILAEQHNKVGDLLFFKGGVSFEKKGSERTKKLGYLVRSRYHYALSLHELRFFNRVRFLRWHENHGGEYEVDGDPPAPVATGEWGDFVFRAAAGSLADLADIFLAQMPLLELLERSDRKASEEKTLVQRLEEKKKQLDDLAKVVVHWLEGTEDEKAVGWRTSVHSLVGGGKAEPGSEERPRRAVEKWRIPGEVEMAPWLGELWLEPGELGELYGKQLSKAKSSREAQEVLARLRQGPESRSPGDAEPRATWWFKIHKKQWSPSSRAEFKIIGDGRVKDLIKFENISDPDELLGCYVAFSWAAAEILQDGGFFEDAARKMLRMLETVVGLLTSISMNRTLAEGDAEEEGEKNEGGSVESPDSYDHSLVRELTDLGILLVQRADNLYRQGRQEWDTKDECEIGTRLPTRMLLLACGLGLARLRLPIEEDKSDLAGKPADQKDRWLGALEQVIHEARGDCGLKSPIPRKSERRGKCSDSSSDDRYRSPGATRAEWRRWFRGQICATLERNAYPLMGRLYGLKILIDDAVLGGLSSAENGEVEEVTLEESCLHLSEFLLLEDLYEGRWHFTPFQSGSTLALWVIQNKENDGDIHKIVTKFAKAGARQDGYSQRLLPKREELRKMARMRLEEGREMYTMRRSYYRSINRLYYLYDDFNDRRIHYNHAIQMASADLSEKLCRRLDSLTGQSSNSDKLSEETSASPQRPLA